MQIEANGTVWMEQVNLRVWQSRMARLRMSVAQQRGEPDEQRPAWRSSRGAAYAAAARARMVRGYILMEDSGS